MKRRKKNICIGIMICILLLLLFFGSFKKTGDSRWADINIGKSNLYTESEIREAVNIVRNRFEDFDGCMMTDLWYDEAVNKKEAKEWSNQYDAKEAIILLSNFKVDSSGGNVSLNPNETYTNWKWILTRNSEDEIWSLQTCGY